MSGANRRAKPRADSNVDPSPAVLATSTPAQRLPLKKINHLISELEVPFDLSAIEWRITKTSQRGQRGQIVPYADPRAYTDRLNALLTPAGWTRRYSVYTSANFERAKDKKLVAKVFVTCELTIFGLGSHSATGEEWADSENAGTAAEAQSFKRAASCFGLGRYLYSFTGIWVDLDERRRPSIPQLFDWATPGGWREGKRPRVGDSSPSPTAPGTLDSEGAKALVHEIEALADAVGKRFYRGVLKRIARVWNPSEIRDPAIRKTVLNEMRAVDVELRRLNGALNQVDPGTVTAILRSLGLHSLDQLDSLELLQKVLAEVDRAAQDGGS